MIQLICCYIHVVFIICVVNSEIIEGNAGHNAPFKNSVSKIKDNSSLNGLSSEPACKHDLRRLCGLNYDTFDNIDVLACVQSYKRDDSAELSGDCQHLLWSYKSNITQDNKLGDIIRQYCKDYQDYLSQCSSGESNGEFASCMMHYVDQLQGKCYDTVVQIGIVIFSDFHLLNSLVKFCKVDIEKFHCGRIESDSAYHHSQGSTIECLENHVSELSNSCKPKILSISTIQSKDIRFDRAFYFACSNELTTFCPHAKFDARAFICLFRFLQDPEMSDECSSQINRHVQLMMVDYKSDGGVFSEDCGRAIKENHCSATSLPDVIVCLNRALKMGKKMKSKCRSLVSMYRAILFSEPLFVLQSCKNELQEYCSDIKDERKIHCLLSHLMKHSPLINISAGCQRSLEDLMKTSNPAENWAVDPVLHDACFPVYQTECSGITGGDGKVIRCLLNSLHSPSMTTECKNALVEIEYFVSRNWRLVPELFANCRFDASRICSAKNDWSNPEVAVAGPDSDILVLPCLFRYAFNPTSEYKLSKTCEKIVKRVMEERAALVELPAYIEHMCFEPLSLLCSGNSTPGAEMQCLKNNYDKLDGSCKNWVESEIKAESKNIRLNNPIMTYCSAIIPKVCPNIVSSVETNENGDKDDAVLDCLMRRKYSPVMQDHPKCVASIENFQLLYIQNIEFSPGLFRSCKSDLLKHCSNSLKASKRREKIDCLAQRLLHDVLVEEQTLTHDCAQNIRFQLSLRHQSIKFDPELKEFCSEDISRFCSAVRRGRGAILNCLRKYSSALSAKCHQVVFFRERVENSDPRTDVILMEKCGAMLKYYCSNSLPKQMIPCLSLYKDESSFDEACKELVLQRLEERMKDILLNPLVYNACKEDINLHCRKQWVTKHSYERNGIVLECLKNQVPLRTLQPTCENKIIEIMRQASQYSRLDPILQEKCSADIVVLCNANDVNHRKGRVEECLKLQLEQNKISSEECKEYLSHLMVRERADIHTDAVLYRTCQSDDEIFCKEKERGEHFACLLDVLDRNPSGLTTECMETLRLRKEMFSTILKVKSVGDLVEGVRSSPERNFFLMLLCSAVGVVFMLGLLFGRVTKKKYKVLKNR